MYEDDRSENLLKGDAPAGKITKIMEDVQPTNEWEVQLWKPLRHALPDPPTPPQDPDLRLNTTGSLAPLSLTSNPAPASTSAPTSAVSSAFSSASSLNVPGHP